MKNTENPMTPPTPAAVRAAMKLSIGSFSEAERIEYRADPRPPDYLLRDHIRAVAQAMRDSANLHRDCGFPDTAQDLSDFADKLEGKQS